MKKKILSGIFALALLVAAGYGVNKSMKSDVSLSDLALANVEALAQGESSGSTVCIQDCMSCSCYIPPIDIDPLGFWVFDAQRFY
jgi:hypothetical protein